MAAESVRIEWLLPYFGSDLETEHPKRGNYAPEFLLPVILPSRAKRLILFVLSLSSLPFYSSSYAFGRIRDFRRFRRARLIQDPRSTSAVRPRAT